MQALVQVRAQALVQVRAQALVRVRVRVQALVLAQALVLVPVPWDSIRPVVERSKEGEEGRPLAVARH